MTAIEALLTDLKSRDIRLWVEDGRLRFSAPEGAMTAPLRQELKLRKEELLDLLGAVPIAAAPAEVVADPANAGAPFPLTRIQQAYWVGRSNPDSFELGGVSAHVYFELDGQGLDLARLEWAWNTLVRRHGMLRAVVDADGRQRVLPDVPEYRVAVADLSAASEAEFDAHIEKVRAELAQYVAPADRWPLFEIRATRMAGDRLRLHISFDGLVFDASSILLLSREAWQLYTTGRDTLPPLSLTFRDYVLAENRLMAGDDTRRARAYWEARLDTLPPAPDLPLAQPMSALGVPVFKRRSFVLDAEAWSGLKKRARAAGLTPSTLLVSAFADIVALWAREPRFTINLSLFNRQPLHPQVDAVVGDFTTLTLLEVDTAAAPLFLDRARAVQARLWQDMDHKAVSGVEVLGLLGRRRGWEGRAAMPVVFTSALSLDAVQGAADGAAEDLCPFGSIGYGITQTPQVLLDVLAVEHRGALHYAWDAVEAAFPPGMLDAMFEAYGGLVGRLANEPGCIESLTRIQPELSFPAAPLRPVSESLLQDAVFRIANEKPEAVAVVTNCKILTFGEIATRSLALKAVICGHGIRPAEPVAVLMDKGWEQVVAVLGILAAGGAYVPIEAAWPASRRDRILQKTNARIVLVPAGGAADLGLPEGRTAIEIAEQAPAEMPALPAIHTRPDDLAYVIFTSGSTGEPKGVMISHRAAVNTIDDINQRWAVGPQDRVLALSALGFDLSVYDIFGVLGAGGAVVVPDAGHDRDPAHWHDLMQKHGVTLWNSVPALMAMLTEFLSAEARASDVPLRLAMLSGDWIPLALPDAVRRAFPHCAVLSLGGATEAAIWSIFHPVDTVEAGWTSIPYGRPLANQDVRVLDHDLATRPAWAVGELFIGGRGVAQGYWGDADLTAQRFVVHPVSGERLYRTGDFGRTRPDGVIEFLGREDRQVKIGGFRIELGEIETTLRQLPGIADAAVEAVGPDRADRRLVAYLVRAEAAPPAAVSENQRYKASRPGGRTDLGTKPSIALPPPEDGALKDILKRQSFREFTDAKIQLADFAKLLQAVCSRPIAGAPVPKRRYPSGGGLYPVQVYLSVKPDRIEGVAAGLYYLDADGGALRQLSSVSATDTIHGEYNRGFVGAAAFDLFLVGNPDVVAAVYPDLARDFCLIEAGAISQLLHDRAPDIGIGLCGIGSVVFDALRDALGLDARHDLLHAVIGGPIAAEQLTRWGAVIPQDGPTDSLVFDHAARDLPAYMVPRQIVWLDRLPLSANGKIDRKALPQVSDQLSRSVPSPVTRSPAGAESGRHTGSHTALDDIVARCVEQVLGYQPVDRTRNLFDLGADSLKIIQIRNRIVASTNRPVGVLDFFRHPTVMLMAEKLQSLGDQRRQ